MIAVAVITCVLVASSCSVTTGRAASDAPVGVGAQTLSDGGRLIVTSREVLLLPHLEAGWAGWCMMDVSVSGGSGCGAARAAAPVVAEDWGSGGPPPITEGDVIVTSEVPAVTIDGSAPIPTRIEAGLPDGMRSVAIEILGKSLLEESEAFPRFAPLNAQGAAISVGPSRPVHLAVEVPTRRLQRPDQEGVCRIIAERMRGLKRIESLVVTNIASHDGLIGRAFLSCASTRYNDGGQVFTAVIFVDADNPGVTPGVLPATKSLLGHRGIFVAPGQETNIVARRIPHGWLVVGGPDLGEKLNLLEHLRAMIHI